MKLKKYLTINSPFNTNDDIDKLFDFIRSRNTCFNEEIKERLLDSSEEEAKPYLLKIIELYVQNYKIRPSNKKVKIKTNAQSKLYKKIEAKVKAQSTSSKSYYKREFPNSLAAMGYEYGLSDW